MEESTKESHSVAKRLMEELVKNIEGYVKDMINALQEQSNQANPIEEEKEQIAQKELFEERRIIF